MSYRTIMQKLKKHPDLGGDEWDASVINEAYAVLSDAKLRAAYDERLLRERTMADAAAQSEAQRGAAQQGEQSQSQRQDQGQGQGQSQSQSEQPHNSDQASEHNGARSSTQSANDDSNSELNACFFCAHSYEGEANEDRNCVLCGSPLMALDPQIHERDNQRVIARQPNYCPLEVFAFWPGEQQAAVLADLSPNGLKFRFSHELHQGHVLKVHCALFTGVVTVAHCMPSDSAYLIGAGFLSVRFAAQQGTFVSTSA